MIEPMTKKQNLIFLDIDGVMNCQVFYEKKHKQSDYKKVKKSLLKAAKNKELTKEEYHASQICPERVALLNQLCEDVQAKVVISSTWRKMSTVEYLQGLFDTFGATFEIIDFTPISDTRLRGVEIYQYLEKMTEKVNYAIIDDQSDMLLWQATHFFQTDEYSGLTPNICYKIKNYFQQF